MNGAGCSKLAHSSSGVQFLYTGLEVLFLTIPSWLITILVLINDTGENPGLEV